MNIPDTLKYTIDHLWIDMKPGYARVGLTDFAQELLGTIGFVELPEAGQKVANKSKLLTIEGLKSIIDISSPFGCTIVKVNDALKKNPELINSGPYSDGWIAELSIDDPKETDCLLSASDYRKKISD